MSVSFFQQRPTTPTAETDGWAFPRSRSTGLTPGEEAKQQYAAAEAADLQAWREYDLPWQRFRRLRDFNINHGRQAYLRRYRKPLGPYGLIFLFHQPAPARAGSDPYHHREIIAVGATRLWLDGPEAEHPIPLLKKLTELTAARDKSQPWDLREHLANRSDDGMAADAVYAGLGLSSLNLAGPGSIEEAYAHAESEYDVPGVMLSLAASPADFMDQQVIVAERRGLRDNNVMTIHTYEALSTYKMHAPYAFAARELRTLYEQTPYGTLLAAMRELDLELRQADTQRRSFHPPRPRRSS